MFNLPQHSTALADDTNAVEAEETADSTVIRSRSSDLLKKSPIDPIVKKGHFNSLKQWGKSRLRMIGRSPSASRDSFRDSLRSEKSKETKSPTRAEETTMQETVTMRRKRPSDEDRRSHQRCASYSSSEKSIGIPTAVQTTATINSGVKLRGTATTRRLRRSGIGKDDIHSSSGNWSASSESGRTSIGSEITTTTVPPKSTTSAGTSNNSLNINHHGPPSSIISRRRFLNTSGSGSVTSEGTLTPDIIHDLHEDLETSSEFSCDTEGYYTSFHMDSGLKTLKEEDISPSTPMHTSNALSNSSNSQTLTAESEYELFGKGSTSTTTSSAGTVCTTLMAAGSDRSLIIGPTVPERKSSLTKLNRGRHNNVHSANASLDRSLNSSFSKSPFSSLRYNPVTRTYTEKQMHNHSSPEISEIPTSTITITRNVGNHMTAVAEIHTETEMESAKKSTGTSSPDSGHNTSSSPIEDSVSSAHGKNSLSEQDYSESSDLEGTDRIERIRYKTTISSARIPSLCVITPTNSDDESESGNKDECESTLKKCASRPKLELPPEDKPKQAKSPTEATKTTKTSAQTKKSSLQPLNSLMCKLKGVLPSKLTSKKSPSPKELNSSDELYDAGDYVTIADVKNNNQKVSLNRGIYGNNDIVRKNLQTVLSGRLPDTEYVSLNELPNCLNESKDYLEREKPSQALEEVQRKGAKVTLDSQGQVVYSSDTLRRRKGAHTTFEPGPFVQELNPTTSVVQRETADVVRITDETDFPCDPQPSSKPTSPQLGKVIIKAPTVPDGPVTKEFIPLPTPKPSTIITASPVTETPPTPTKQSPAATSDPPRVVDAITRTGAYVNIHDADGVSLSPTKDHLEGKSLSPKTFTRNLFIKSKLEQLDLSLSPEVDTDIVPFVPNFQSPRMLERKGGHDFGNSGSKAAEVLRMFCANKLNGHSNGEVLNKSNSNEGHDKSINNKVKRSDSYKLANSPLMPIKKLLKLESFGGNAKKVDSLEMIQAEITADLLRDEINYPPTVSPKLSPRNIMNSLKSEWSGHDDNTFIGDHFEAELSALTLSPFATPVPKRHTVAFIPDGRDTSLDLLTSILESDPDEVCLLHSPPSCPLSPNYRHSSADKAYMNIPPQVIQERAPVIDMSPLSPALQPPHAAHLRGRHGVLTYENPTEPRRHQPMYWTLPKRTPPPLEPTIPRSKTYEQRSDYFAPKPSIQPDPFKASTSQASEESIRISPIDPRSVGPFKSSTPAGKDTVVDLGKRMLSPVKSTMTNEELYAIIHKSKKKLNIKDGPERSASPALSTISLSPVNSESSLYCKGTQRHPETGYLGDPRSRNSWSTPSDRVGVPVQHSATNRVNKPETTCADRYGPVPQTSRLDFKKLLLQHSVKLNTLNPQKSTKLSAVEQLRLAKERTQTLPSPGANANRSHVNILDLSGSPKTYAQRKIMKPAPQPASPGRAGALIKEHKASPKILLSPKSQWRFSSPRSDVLSSPIPEANNEDETSNSSGEKHDTSPNHPQVKTVPINTNQHFGARRNLIPINEIFERDTESPDLVDQGVFPLSGEKSPGLTRTELLQARRAEFFNTPPEASPPKLSSFRQPAAAARSKTPEKRMPSPSTLETAL
ncbi:unnamed protein product [Plutella xylostella]|uniref:(diamondback moth) hypothetical protein n=1 Tax=Plutella xylostella TaxID=51655 RepID=A0A8S4G6D1_PLUXY|nr:unnamed protein product [Plutella xylostella]